MRYCRTFEPVATHRILKLTPKLSLMRYLTSCLRVAQRSKSSYPGKFVELPDGTQVGLRSASRSGGATIDVFKPDGTYIKVHLP